MREIVLEKRKIEKHIGRRVVQNTPKVSIITPAYNLAGYIKETLDSVFAQTYRNFEIIIVNDGSPDTEDFEKVLEPYFEKIIYIKAENQGAGAARNLAIETARGELLAFLDGDDIWLPEFLASQIEFLEKNALDLVYSDALLFGDAAFEGKNYMLGAPSVGEADFESLLDLRCNVITSGTVCRRKNVLDAGMFETEKVRAHDFVLWLKMAQNGAKIGYQKKILLKHRIRLDSLSGDSIQRVQREIDVYHRILKSLELDENHRQIVENQLKRLEAEKELERGKSFLLGQDFVSARKAFETANEYRQSSRLRVIIWLIKFAPKLLLKIYHARRAGEINFVPDRIK